MISRAKLQRLFAAGQYAEISRLYHQGELEAITRGDDVDAEDSNDQRQMVSQEKLASMTPEEVSAAYHENRIEGLSGE